MKKPKLGRPFEHDWSKWDEKLTIRENCKRVGVSYAYGRSDAYRVGRKFKPCFKRKVVV